MTSDHPTDTPVPASRAGPQELKQKLIEEFGEDLEDMHVSEAEAAEYLVTLWNILTMIVDLGFDLGPVPKKLVDNGAALNLDWGRFCAKLKELR